MIREQSRVRLLIADDNTVMRDTLVNLVSITETIQVVGQATDGFEAVTLCAQLDPDVVLMDLRMPKMDGIEATRLICSQFKKTQVIMLSGSYEASTVERALQAGARNYLIKTTPLEDIIDAIVVAHRGG